MDYSSHGEIGGTLHLPSPTFAHHIDTIPTTDLRRSLSRSPSKPQRYLFAQTPTRSSAASLSPLLAPRSFSPQLPPPQSTLFSIPTTNSMSHTPPPPKKKLNLSSFKRPLRSARNSSTRSPMRRALGDSSHHGNVTPFLSRQNSGEENDTGSASTDSSGSKSASDEKPPLFRFDSNNISAPVKFDPLRPRSHTIVAMADAEPARSSPLKRGDVARHLGQADLSTPVKRRSIHGGIFAGDFDVFNQSSPLNFDSPINIHDENERPTHQVEPSMRLFANVDMPQNSFSSPVLKRNGSSRKAIRHGPLLGRNRGFHDSSHDAMSQSSPANKAKNRSSMDASLLLRNSPLTLRSTTSNTSAHPIFQQSQAMKSASSILDHQPHPLSRSLVPSSSGSSLIEDDLQFPKNAESTNQSFGMQKPPLPQHKNPVFSKSLPIGALRPNLKSNNTNSSGESYATPAPIKSGKHPGGYMSTGLISKRNRNPDYHPYNDTERYVMPDTPSKRASFPPVTTTPSAKMQHSVFANFQDLGTPLPSNPTRTSITNLFRRSANKGRSFGQSELVRRSSFISEDGDDRIDRLDSHSSADELPPTPTKANAHAGNKSKPTSLRSSIFGRRTSLGPDTFLPVVQTTSVEPDTAPLVRKGKQNHVLFPKSAKPNDLHVIAENVAHSDPLLLPALQFSRSVDVVRLPRLRSTQPVTVNELTESSEDLIPMSPLTSSYQALPVSTSFSPETKAKQRQRIVTPSHQTSNGSSPQTPQSYFNPADSNFLSAAHFRNSTTAIPATPTAQRDGFLGMSIGHPAYNDVDTSITSRFASVTTIAQGEFSVVYRVEQPTETTFTGRQSLGTPGNAWVVKKTKKPYVGGRDRAKKLREVAVLQILRGQNHVLEFKNSWEADGHLYIQTEFCENGNLSTFLAETGNKARLDDFRIWKILLELALGVKAIHSSGFIHLDLKPANVFIAFNGSLKIGDFGLASPWPAPKDIDGEGDREYISPEALHGRFDKPSDVFAIGLMTLEIAGNFFLPDNGEQWQRLRSGNLSDIPSLTWSTESQLDRDENGDPVEGDSPTHALIAHGHNPLGLQHPPSFMQDYKDSNSLDHLVEWMLCPNPDERPTAEQVYLSEPLQWISHRRRAGATIYEGNWGPADHVLQTKSGIVTSDGFSLDVEMSDV